MYEMAIKEHFLYEKKLSFGHCPKRGWVGWGGPSQVPQPTCFWKWVFPKSGGDPV